MQVTTIRVLSFVLTVLVVVALSFLSHARHPSKAETRPLPSTLMVPALLRHPLEYGSNISKKYVPLLEGKTKHAD